MESWSISSSISFKLKLYTTWTLLTLSLSLSQSFCHFSSAAAFSIKHNQQVWPFKRTDDDDGLENETKQQGREGKKHTREWSWVSSSRELARTSTTSQTSSTRNEKLLLQIESKLLCTPFFFPSPTRRRRRSLAELNHGIFHFWQTWAAASEEFFWPHPSRERRDDVDDFRCKSSQFLIRNVRNLKSIDLEIVFFCARLVGVEVEWVHWGCVRSSILCARVFLYLHRTMLSADTA